MKPITIKDDQGIDCIIDDIKSFYDHILKYHHSSTSLHEEGGHYFTVDDAFRKKVRNLFDAELINEKN